MSDFLSSKEYIQAIQKNLKSMKRAIRAKCFECSGESSKELTLCHLFDCPLWPFRHSSPIRSKQYREEMENALRFYKQDVDELKRLGVDLKLYIPALHQPRRGR